jgi:hypothetical protein
MEGGGTRLEGVSPCVSSSPDTFVSIADVSSYCACSTSGFPCRAPSAAADAPQLLVWTQSLGPLDSILGLDARFGVVTTPPLPHATLSGAHIPYTHQPTPTGILSAPMVVGIGDVPLHIDHKVTRIYAVACPVLLPSDLYGTPSPGRFSDWLRLVSAVSLCSLTPPARPILMGESFIIYRQTRNLTSPGPMTSPPKVPSRESTTPLRETQPRLTPPLVSCPSARKPIGC